MSECIIPLNHIDPVSIFGPREGNLDYIKKYFPLVRIIQRGDEIKAIGSALELEEFEKKMLSILNYFELNNRMSEEIIDKILLVDINSPVGAHTNILEQNPNNIILNGANGKIIRAITANQIKLIRELEKNDMVFAIGPAGSGKTYTAVALAVKALKNKEVRKIVLTRPAVEAGENLGFLPGDMKEKLDPYLQPLYDALRDMIPSQKLQHYIEEGFIEIAPLAFMRGRTLDNAFVILDEAQNAVESQMKMFLTRMGKSAKFIITGDVSQIDLPRHQRSGLIQASKILDKVEGISFVYLNSKDVLRHPLVASIINAYQNPIDA